jgi:hypothetical protein
MYWKSEIIIEELKQLFAPYGTCYVKARYDGKKNLPAAFVQFEVSLMPRIFCMVI